MYYYYHQLREHSRWYEAFHQFLTSRERERVALYSTIQCWIIVLPENAHNWGEITKGGRDYEEEEEEEEGYIYVITLNR